MANNWFMWLLAVNILALSCGFAAAYYASMGSRKFLIFDLIYAPLMIVVDIIFLQLYVESVRMCYYIFISFYAAHIWKKREITHSTESAYTMVFTQKQRWTFAASYVGSIVIAYFISAMIQDGNDNSRWTILADAIIAMTGFWALALTPKKYMASQYLWLLLNGIYIIYLTTIFSEIWNIDGWNAATITLLLGARVYYFAMTVLGIAVWSKQVSVHKIKAR